MPLQKPSAAALRELAGTLLLELDESEYALLTREFSGILDQLERVMRIDTNAVAPTDFVAIPSPKAVDRLRLDAPSDRLFTVNEMAANTPFVLNGLLLVGESK